MSTIRELEARVGGLSESRKMPWYGYSLPASACNVGGTLRHIPGSVCSKCYAHKGRYRFHTVKRAQRVRLRHVQHTITWTADMIQLLARKSRGKPQHFRWHSSGDVQSVAHMAAILIIANELPHIQFWLPTKEYELARMFSNITSKIPNLTVRISAPMLGAVVIGKVTSSVDAGVGFTCPAPIQNGKCGICRACWDKSVGNVDYPLH